MVLLAITAAVGLSSPVDDQMKNQDDAAAGIGRLHAAWSSAIGSGDVDAALDLLCDDYILLSPGNAPVKREALRPALLGAVKRFQITSTFVRDELLVSGDLCFERGWDVQETCAREGGDVQSQRQYVFLILRRDKDGRWKFARAMRQPSPNG